MSTGPTCPLCGSTASKQFVRERLGYALWDCPACGAGFCDPFKNPGPEYYEHNQDLYSIKIDTATDPMSYEYDEALGLLRSMPQGSRLLDVGCGAGGFLHRAKQMGLSVSGIDFNSQRVKALSDAGFSVFQGSLPDFARGSTTPFDVVTMFEIIEHLDNIADWLAATESVLKPGGLLIIGTPNRERRFDPFQGPGLEDIDNPPHHLTRWSQTALKDILTRAGFQVEECRPLGYPLALTQLMLRNTLRLGLATKALGNEQLRHTPAPNVAPARAGAVRGLVAVKETVLNSAATIGYPFFRASCTAFGWQGAILFAAARTPDDSSRK